MKHEDLEELPVEEVMDESPVFVDPETTVQEAAELLKKNRETGSLIVKDREEIKGIVTNCDIVEKYVVERRGDKVRDVMTQDLVTVSPRREIEEAALIMVKRGVERLPVMEDEDLIGVISANDIIKVQPSLYLELTEGLKLGEERFGEVSTNRDVGQCESCENYSENLEEIEGQMLCEECREKF